MTIRSFFSAARFAAALLAPLGSPLFAETGMCLVTTGTTFADLRIGPIHRIDIINDTVKDTTRSLGNGVSPRFSPDHTRFCFLKDGTNTVEIRTIDGGSIRTFAVDALPGDGGTLSWTTSGIWVGVDGKIVKYDSLGSKVKTFTTAAYEQRGTVSLNEITGGGVYINGTWKPRVYQMRSGIALSPTTDGDGCSVCPSPNGLLLTNNLRTSTDGIHRAMRILDTTGAQASYLYMKDITRFSSAGYHMDMQTWSGNSNEWILIPVGTGGEVPSDNCSPCLYNIVTHQKLCLKDNSATNDHWQPFDYYSGWAPTSASPVLQLSPSQLAFSADSGGANPPSQIVIASTPNGTLAGLTITGQKSWMAAVPPASSGPSITITLAPTISGLAAGVYRDTLRVNTTNAGQQACLVTLTIRKPAASQVLSSVSVTPSWFTVAAGSAVPFNVTCKDQNDGYLRNPSVTWWTSGGGSINAAGLYTAASAPSFGPHLVVATLASGGVTIRDTAMLNVSWTGSMFKRIDCGADSLCPSGWETDNQYVAGGADANLSGTVSTTGVIAAAPANVYRSVRLGNPHSYSIAGMPAGGYTLRLHLIDPMDTVRSMSFTVLSQNVIRDLSVTSLAGGALKPLVLDFPTTVQQDGAMTIQCSAASGDVFEAGLEILENSNRPITLLSPRGGERYTVGSVVKVQWVNDTVLIRQVYVDVSVDDGRTFTNVTGNYGIAMSDPGGTWPTYSWTIPDSLQAEGGLSAPYSTVSTRCRIRVRPYTNIQGGSDISPAPFTIEAGSGVGQEMRRRSVTEKQVCSSAGHAVSIFAQAPGRLDVAVFSVSGRLLVRRTGDGELHVDVPRAPNRGILVVRMTTTRGTRIERIAD